VITDTYTPWPETEPAAKVVVAAVKPAAYVSDDSFAASVRQVPEWAKTIVVHKDEAA
jgi:hypothetical protein